MPQDREVPIQSAATPRTERESEPSFGDLVSRLTTQTSTLVRNEIALAKVELRETGATLARDAARAGTGLVLAWAGVLSLTAALIMGLGHLLNNVWLAALIVGAVYVIVGGLLARSAMADVRRHGLAPKQTLETLRDDTAWAKAQVKSVGDDLKR